MAYKGIQNMVPLQIVQNNKTGKKHQAVVSKAFHICPDWLAGINLGDIQDLNLTPNKVLLFLTEKGLQMPFLVLFIIPMAVWSKAN